MGFLRWKLLSWETKAFVWVIVVEAALIVGLTIQDLFANAPMTRANRYHFEFGILFLICALAAAGFALSGAVRENVLELAIFVFSLLLCCVYVAYSYVSPSPADKGGGVTPHSPAAIVRLVVVALALVVSVPLSYVVQRDFGWRSYKIVGANLELTSAFNAYSLLVGCLKLDALVAFVTLYIAAMTLLHETGLVADSLALILTWAGLGAAARGARKENTLLIVVFAVIAFVEPAYVAYKLIEYSEHEDEYNTRVRYLHALIAVGVVATLIRIASLLLTLRVWTSFGKGLASALDNAESRRADESTNFHIGISSSGTITALA